MNSRRKLSGCGIRSRRFYNNLHCYVRGRLNEKYGDAVQPATGPIRADLTGQYVGPAMGQYLRRRGAAIRALELRFDATFSATISMR